MRPQTIEWPHVPKLLSMPKLSYIILVNIVCNEILKEGEIKRKEKVQENCAIGLYLRTFVL